MTHSTHDSLGRLLIYLIMLFILTMLLMVGACSIVFGKGAPITPGHPIHQEVRWYA